MFPTAHSQIYRNEAGEVLGWDTPSEPDDWYDPEPSAREMAYEDAYDDGRYDAENDEEFRENYATDPKLQAAYKTGYEENR